MFDTTSFRIPPAVGEIIGIGLVAIGITSGVASIVVMGAVIVAAATVRFAHLALTSGVPRE